MHSVHCTLYNVSCTFYIAYLYCISYIYSLYTISIEKEVMDIPLYGVYFNMYNLLSPLYM